MCNLMMFTPASKRIFTLSKKFQWHTDKLFSRYFCSKMEEALQRPQASVETVPLNETIARIPRCGQPTFITHPFLLSEGEILPGLRKEEFKKRRQKFMELIFADSLLTYGKPMHHVIIVPSATKQYMTEKIPYIFHQNTDFLYLSGCLEPDTALVMTGSCNENMTSTFFVQKPDPHAEVWDGPRTGINDAPELFGVNKAFTILDLPNFLARHAEKHSDYLLYYDLLNNNSLVVQPFITDHIKKFNIKLCQSCKKFVDKLRLIKSPAEQNLMRRAGEISSLAIEKAMQVTKPGVTEHQLFATVDYESRIRGAEILAYPPVVASGKNANIIHYISNNQIVNDGDLILMDAGCEYHGYCGDITRTWPVNGKFSNYQRILYEIVLEVQKNLIDACAEKSSLNILYKKMLFQLGQHLRSEKILNHSASNSIELNEIARQLCPHHVSHYLGMDVHDGRTVEKDIPLVPGMIVTIEPGLYTKENPNLAPEFWNLGIRIEDDILITDTSYEILSARCPKEVQDIENIMNQNTQNQM